MLLNNGSASSSAMRPSSSHTQRTRPGLNDENAVKRSGKSKKIVGGGGGGALMISNDENSYHARKKMSGGKGKGLKVALAPSSTFNGGGSKTPKSSSTSSRRRALGDISNRKQQQHSGSQGGGGDVSLPSFNAKPSKSKPSKATKSVTFQTPHRGGGKPHSNSQQRTRPKGITPAGSTVKRNNRSSFQQTPGKAKSDFVLPQRTVSFDLGRTSKSAEMVPSSGRAKHHQRESKGEPVEDVEFPAGRLWSEERDQQSDDDSDSDLSFELGRDYAADIDRMYLEDVQMEKLKKDERVAEAGKALDAEIDKLYRDGLEYDMESLIETLAIDDFTSVMDEYPWEEEPADKYRRSFAEDDLSL